MLAQKYMFYVQIFILTAKTYEELVIAEIIFNPKQLVNCQNNPLLLKVLYTFIS